MVVVEMVRIVGVVTYVRIVEAGKRRRIGCLNANKR